MLSILHCSKSQRWCRYSFHAPEKESESAPFQDNFGDENSNDDNISNMPASLSELKDLTSM